MKRVEIRNIEDLIKRLDLSKVEKDTAKLIINFHLAVFKEDKITTEKMDEVKNMLLKDKDDEIAILADYRQKIAEQTRTEDRISLTGIMKDQCKDILAVEKSLQDKFDEIGKEDVEVTFTPIPIDAMLSALESNGMSYNVETMEILNLIS